MVGSVDDLDLEVDHGIARQHAARGGFADAVLDRLDELLGDVAADDLVLDDDARAALQRGDVDDAVAVLTVTAGLPDELAVGVAGLGEGFAVRHLRRAGVRLDLELADQTVENDLEMQLAHAGDDRLTGLLVGAHLEGRILLRQRDQPLVELVAVAAGLGLDGDRDDRLGEEHRLQHDRIGFEAQRVAGGHVLEPHRRRDVAGEDLLLLDAAVRVHLQQTPHALALAGARVEHRHALRRHARVDPEIVKLAHERVAHDLEDQRREGLQIADVTGDRLAGVGIGALDVPDVQRAGQIVGHDVEQRLDALVLERGRRRHRDDARLDRRAAHRLAQIVDRRGLVVEEDLHDLVVDFGETLDHMLERRLAARLLIVGQLLFVDRDALVLVGEVQRLVAEHVDHALEARLAADGQHHGHGSRAEFGLDLAHRAVEVGAGTVHLVDQRHDRHVVLLRLPPHRLGLGLDLADRAEDRDRAVEHPQTALHLGGEVDMSRSVDDVHAVPLPVAGGRRAGDGDAAFALLLHPVHGRRALVGVADLVVDAGIEEDALGQRRLSGVDMRHDADVARLFQRHLAVR